jgi:hypothetical protein
MTTSILSAFITRLKDTQTVCSLLCRKWRASKQASTEAQETSRTIKNLQSFANIGLSAPPLGENANDHLSEDSGFEDSLHCGRAWEPTWSFSEKNGSHPRSSRLAVLLGHVCAALQSFSLVYAFRCLDHSTTSGPGVWPSSLASGRSGRRSFTHTSVKMFKWLRMLLVRCQEASSTKLRRRYGPQDSS